MTPRLSVLSVGSITLFDHMLAVPGLPAAGDAILLDSPAGRTHFGGCGVNQAMAAAALGFAAGTCMVAGADFDGSGYRRYLVDAGVDVSGVTVLDDERSGHSYLVFEPSGDSFLVVETGAARRQAEHRPPVELLRAARAVLLNMPFDAYCEVAAETARAAGATVVASGQLMTAPPDVQRRVLAHCTHVACNGAEREALRAAHGTADFGELVGDGFAGAFVTAGRDGVTVVGPDGAETHVAAAPVTLVDPIGAGDAFAAAAAGALTEGLSLVDAARFASVAASFVVEAEGCQSNLPDRARVAARYRTVHGTDSPLAGAPA
jgi:nucleoside kinase